MKPKLPFRIPPAAFRGTSKYVDDPVVLGAFKGAIDLHHVQQTSPANLTGRVDHRDREPPILGEKKKNLMLINLQ